MELFDHLKLLGFQDDRFLTYLKARIVLGVPDFHLDYITEIDNNKMSFRLYFQRTGTDGNYCLHKYDAILWRPVDIVHCNIAGIYTSVLEERMSRIDWSRVPDGSFPENISMVERIRGVCDDLQVIQSQSIAGWAISQQLRLKYWSGTPFDSAELEYLRKQQQTLKTFTGNLPDINQCYHIHFRLWDIRCQLLESLAYIGLDMEALVERKLMVHYPGPFTLTDFRRQEEGIVRYTIPVTWDHEFSCYSIKNYEASLFRLRPIVHGHYGGIDTAGLEAKMAAIDWDNEYSHYTEGEEDPRFVPEIEEVISALHYQLPEDPEGNMVSLKLQARYWPGSPDFSNVMEEAAWAYLNAQPSINAAFGSDIHATEAYNLLCGRAICYEWEGLWSRLGLNTETEIGYPLIEIRSYSKYELEAHLQTLPIATGSYSHVCDALLHGDIASVTLLSGKEIRIIADPESRSLKFFTSEMKAVDPSMLGYSSIPILKQENKPEGEDKRTGMAKDKQVHRGKRNSKRGGI